MEDNIPKTTNTSNTNPVIAALVIAVVLLGAMLAFAYFEMSSMRRDLYGIRDDYYGSGVNNSTDMAQEQFTSELLSQKVQKMRVVDYLNANYDDPEDIYIEKDVRVVELKIQNNQDFVLSFYDSISLKDENGKLIRPLSVHPEDDLNNGDGYSMIELAPGGSGTIYLYFPDTGNEIMPDDLYNVGTY